MPWWAVDISCTLEPCGLHRGDGRRPDGIASITCTQGHCLVWDATCHYTFALTNISIASNGAGLVADRAASGKRVLYSDLYQSCAFIPVAVESSRSIGKDVSFSMSLADVQDVRQKTFYLISNSPRRLVYAFNNVTQSRL